MPIPRTRSRSLADDLRARPADALAALLAQRPDLLLPAPESISDLAARAATIGSVRMALHRLDRRTLAVATAIGRAGGLDPAAPEALGPLADQLSGEEVEAAITRLHELALVWAEGERMRPVRALPEVVVAMGLDASALIAAEPAAARPGRTVDPALVDRMAGQQGLLAVQTMRDLLRQLDELSLRLTRDGVVAVRDLTTTAAALSMSEGRLAMWLELGWGAGLLGPSADGEVVLPTVAGGVWASGPASRAWSLLLQAWWFADRDWDVFERAVADRSEADVRPYVFGGQHAATLAGALRREYVTALAGLQPGAVLADPVRMLAERRPLVDAARVGELASAAVAQAEVLGVTGRGALSTAGRALLADAAAPDPADPAPEEAIVAVLEGLLPPEIDRVVVQGDSTIVAPGPLAPALAEAIGSFAGVESTGGATVYRLSVASVEAALDRGWTGERILEVLRTASDTPLPQPVEYLITDTAARHGRIRIGAVASYVVTEDLASLELLLQVLERSGVPMSRVAPTVAVSSRPPDVVLRAARAGGVGVTGVSVGSEPVQRPPVAPPPRPPAPVVGADPARARATAAMLVATAAPVVAEDLPPAPQVERMHPAQAQAVLAAALARRGRVWLRHADNAGRDSIRLVEPLHLSGGVLEAIDLERGKPRRFAIARIVGALPLTSTT